MNVTVEMMGAARAVSGAHRVTLDLGDGSTYRDIIQKLGEMYPDLIGVIIDQDGKSLLSSILLYVNDDQWIMPGMWDQKPKDGDHLRLLGVITGG
ncbi:MAG: MoaD/ThiS family protein [Anaerolineae bacterium]|nr:MoaD/ThiS family protein [Anaerolineae bacterium]